MLYEDRDLVLGDTMDEDVQAPICASGEPRADKRSLHEDMCLGRDTESANADAGGVGPDDAGLARRLR